MYTVEHGVYRRTRGAYGKKHVVHVGRNTGLYTGNTDFIRGEHGVHTVGTRVYTGEHMGVYGRTHGVYTGEYSGVYWRTRGVYGDNTEFIQYTRVYTEEHGCIRKAGCIREHRCIHA